MYNHQRICFLYSSLTDILLIVSYPNIILKLNVADCIRRALRPFVNIFNLSSLHKSVKTLLIVPTLWTCNLALTTSNGFVMTVVVKPPKVPAIVCINR